MCHLYEHYGDFRNKATDEQNTDANSENRNEQLDSAEHENPFIERKQNNDFIIIPNRADIITIAESRAKRRGHGTWKRGRPRSCGTAPLPFSLEQAGCVEDLVDVRGGGSCGDCEAGEEPDALEHGDGTGGDGETEGHCQDKSGDEGDDSLNDSAHVSKSFLLAYPFDTLDIRPIARQIIYTNRTATNPTQVR